MGEFIRRGRENDHSNLNKEESNQGQEQQDLKSQLAQMNYEEGRNAIRPGGIYETQVTTQGFRNQVAAESGNIIDGSINIIHSGLELIDHGVGYDTLAQSPFVDPEEIPNSKGSLRKKLALEVSGEENPDQDDLDDIASKDLGAIPIRAEVAKMVVVAAGLEKIGLIPMKAHDEKDGYMNQPVDIAEVPDWSEPYIRSTYLNGLMMGTENGKGPFNAIDQFHEGHVDDLIRQVNENKGNKRSAAYFEELYRSDVKYSRNYFEANPEIMGDLENEVFLYEMLAHHIAYKDAENLTVNEEYLLHSWGYDPEPAAIIDNRSTGIYVVGFKSLEGEHLPKIVAFRGSEFDTYQDTLTDFDHQGVGYLQYMNSLGDLNTLMDDMGSGPYVTTGHSLGGAHAQRFALYNSEVNNLYTFQSPGLSGTEAILTDSYEGKSFHYTDAKDVVHTVGKRSVYGDGNAVLANPKMKYLEEREKLVNQLTAAEVNDIASLTEYLFNIEFKISEEEQMILRKIVEDIGEAHTGYFVADPKMLEVGSSTEPEKKYTANATEQGFQGLKTDAEAVRIDLANLLDSSFVKNFLIPQAIAYFEIKSENYKERSADEIVTLLQDLMNGATTNGIEDAIIEVLDYIGEERGKVEFNYIVERITEKILFNNVHGDQHDVLKNLIDVNKL